MTRDRLIRAAIGAVTGAGVGVAVWLSMRDRDVTWSLGPNQPVIAGVLAGGAVAVLFLATSPKKPR